jgi:5'-deoxynucleotidase YfbR-like HD superfamily hydrolase
VWLATIATHAMGPSPYQGEVRWGSYPSLAPHSPNVLESDASVSLDAHSLLTNSTPMARNSTRAWQRMLSGRRLDILDPSPVDVELSDIAHGLARVARWNGQTIGDYPFSVAQHSVLVLELYRAANPEAGAAALLQTLLHDAPEYVMGDIISPFKTAMGGNYKDVENRLLAAIYLRFSLPATVTVAVKKQMKRADQEAAYFEATHLAGFEPAEATRLFGEPGTAAFEIDQFDRLIQPWPTREAHDRFIASFELIARLIPAA